jgi:hypothetical protein
LDRRLAGLREERAALAQPVPAVPVEHSRAQWEARWEAADPVERRILLKLALRGRALVIAPVDKARPRGDGQPGEPLGIECAKSC